MLFMKEKMNLPIGLYRWLMTSKQTEPYLHFTLNQKWRDSDVIVDWINETYNWMLKYLYFLGIGGKYILLMKPSDGDL